MSKRYSKEWKNKISKTLMGYKHSNKTKEKMSKSRKGKKRPPFSEKWKINIGLSKKGKKQSEQSKELRSKSLKKYYKKHPVWNKNKKCPQMSGENNSQWKGGITKHTSGYILVLDFNHPFCDKSGYVPQHRLVMEKHLGRYLRPEERIHHKGIKYPINSIKNKQDNRIENLMLFKNIGSHSSFHNKLKLFSPRRFKLTQQSESLK